MELFISVSAKFKVPDAGFGEISKAKPQLLTVSVLIVGDPVPFTSQALATFIPTAPLPGVERAFKTRLGVPWPDT